MLDIMRAELYMCVESGTLSPSGGYFPRPLPSNSRFHVSNITFHSCVLMRFTTVFFKLKLAAVEGSLSQGCSFHKKKTAITPEVVILWRNVRCRF